jgi:hypothetical protein
MRFFCYLLLFWTFSAYTLDLKPLLVLSILEVLSDLSKRIFDIPPAAKVTINPRSFTLSFLTARLHFRSDCNLFFTLAYYHLLPSLMTNQALNFDLQPALHLTCLRLALLYADTLYK